MMRTRRTATLVYVGTLEGGGSYSHMTYEGWSHDIWRVAAWYMYVESWLDMSEAVTQRLTYMTQRLVERGYRFLHAHTKITWHLHTLFWVFWASHVQQILLAWRSSIVGKITIDINSTNPTQTIHNYTMDCRFWLDNGHITSTNWLVKIYDFESTATLLSTAV